MPLFRQTTAPQHLFRRHRPKLRRLMLPAHSLNCPECGLLIEIPMLGQGRQADCPRCHHELVRVENRPFTTPPALALATLILLLCV